MSVEQGPKVGIIMGSVSDLDVMQHAGRALREVGNFEYGIDYEDRVVSAHRTPDWMREYADTAEDRGLQVIIAGAGGSAHLQGMTASETAVPILGVAVTKNPDVMNRALGSCIGMPEGAPLSTFQGEAGAFNAGLQAIKILALNDPELRQAYKDYRSMLAAGVHVYDDLLGPRGAEKYLENEEEMKRSHDRITKKDDPYYFEDE